METPPASTVSPSSLQVEDMRLYVQLHVLHVQSRNPCALHAPTENTNGSKPNLANDLAPRLVPKNNHEDFIKIALKQFRLERTRDLTKYYYNIFLPRRLASLFRATGAGQDRGCRGGEEPNNSRRKENTVN